MQLLLSTCLAKHIIISIFYAGFCCLIWPVPTCVCDCIKHDKPLQYQAVHPIGSPIAVANSYWQSTKSTRPLHRLARSLACGLSLHGVTPARLQGD